jgi:hypothetical protein
MFKSHVHDFDWKILMKDVAVDGRIILECVLKK